MSRSPHCRISPAAFAVLAQDDEEFRAPWASAGEGSSSPRPLAVARRGFTSHGPQRGEGSAPLRKRRGSDLCAAVAGRGVLASHGPCRSKGLRVPWAALPCPSASPSLIASDGKCSSRGHRAFRGGRKAPDSWQPAGSRAPLMESAPRLTADSPHFRCRVAQVPECVTLVPSA